MGTMITILPGLFSLSLGVKQEFSEIRPSRESSINNIVQSWLSLVDHLGLTTLGILLLLVSATTRILRLPGHPLFIPNSLSLLTFLRVTKPFHWKPWDLWFIINTICYALKLLKIPITVLLLREINSAVGYSLHPVKWWLFFSLSILQE